MGPGIQEDHREAVQGKKLVVGFWREHVKSGLSELNPHHQRFDAPDDEKDEGRYDVAKPDLLVVNSRQYAAQTRSVFPILRPVPGSASGLF